MLTDKDTLIQKTITLLEFGTILECLTAHSMSEESSVMIREEKPCRESAGTIKIKEAVQAVISRVNSGEKDPRRYLPSIGFLLPKLGVEGIILDPDEACAIGLFIERGEELKTWLIPETVFSVMLNDIPDCKKLAIAVFDIMDREGNIRDLPELRAIKQSIRNLNTAMEIMVSRYTTDEETKRMLQSTLPSQRDGRTVLAVKANFRGRIKGIVHEFSSSGQTIFLEPEDVVEKNNEILIKKRELDTAIKKIMLNLTKQLAEHISELTIFHTTILNIEVLMAKARYSLETGGCFARESTSLTLVQAKHPLLKNPVPIDLSMVGGSDNENIQALIVTGPNTGGKTVALKTAGLLAMMNQIGLALPAAEGTTLPVFDGIFADIGDEQSIGQSLSTFSAHITNIAAIITHSSTKSLVLLDELGSGTDPQEGSAIAMAILDCLIERKTRLLITTHHGILKNYGYSRQEVENASVEFNTKTLSPTYRIITGLPGESRALEIAARNGMPADIITSAKNYLNEGHSDVSALISGLKEKHRELNILIEKAQIEETRLKDERKKTDLKELRLRQKEAELKAGLAGKLRLLLDESRKTLENLVREVKEGAYSSESVLTREKTLKVKEFLGELNRAVEAEDAALKEEELLIAEERRNIEKTKDGKTQIVEFKPGMPVFVGNAGRRGMLVRPDKKSSSGKKWIVETGSLKISFPESELVPASPLKLKPAIASIDVKVSSAVRGEINLCGMRMEEALETLRRQTEAALLCGLKNFAVIHGKGDGILQKGVHEWLKNEPSVEDYYFARPELGGFGRTEVVLK